MAAGVSTSARCGQWTAVARFDGSRGALELVGTHDDDD